MTSPLHTPRSARLLDQVREMLRHRHYSSRTEKAYLYWVRFFVRWHGRGGTMRHPRDIGAREVRAFLLMLANERKVAVSTHNQALSALLFLYREVLALDLPWLQDLKRPIRARQVPAVLTPSEVASLLGALDGDVALLARLLYGTGMRLLEGVTLRIQDVDFARLVITVRDGKGGKDRVVMLPRSLLAPLQSHLAAVHRLWVQDRARGTSGVPVGKGRADDHSDLRWSWSWYWLFPAPRLSVDRRSHIEHRAHLHPERLQRAIKIASAKAGIDKRVSVHTLRLSFATHTPGVRSPLDTLEKKISPAPTTAPPRCKEPEAAYA